MTGELAEAWWSNKLLPVTEHLSVDCSDKDIPTPYRGNGAALVFCLVSLALGAVQVKLLHSSHLPHF